MFNQLRLNQLKCKDKFRTKPVTFCTIWDWYNSSSGPVS